MIARKLLLTLAALGVISSWCLRSRFAGGRGAGKRRKLSLESIPSRDARVTSL